MNPGPPSEPQPDLLTPRPVSATPPALARTIEELRQHAQDTKTLFNATFVALILLALGVNFFIGKQMRMVGDQLTDQRPQMQRADTEFVKRDAEFRRFITTLQQFAATHPDYAPILGRYRGLLPQYFPGTTVLSGTPDPGAKVPAPALKTPAK